jgi:hypothetical protein
MSRFLLDETPPHVDEPAAAAAIAQVTQDDAALAPLGERVLADLAATQRDDGLLAGPDDRTQQDRALTSAFVLCLLAGDERFRQTVRFADLMSWFEQHADELDGQTRSLWRLATLDVPATVMPRRGPALAA